MHFWKHTAACTLIGVGAAVLTGHIDYLNLGMLLAGGVLVDLDHPVYFLCKYKRNFEEIKIVARECFSKSQEKFYIFHTFEFMILLWWLVNRYEGLKYLWIGYMVHMMMDIYVYLKRKKNREWIKMWIASYQLVSVAGKR